MGPEHPRAEKPHVKPLQEYFPGLTPLWSSNPMKPRVVFRYFSTSRLFLLRNNLGDKRSPHLSAGYGNCNHLEDVMSSHVVAIELFTINIMRTAMASF